MSSRGASPGSLLTSSSAPETHSDITVLQGSTAFLPCRSGQDIDASDNLIIHLEMLAVWQEDSAVNSQSSVEGTENQVLFGSSGILEVDDGLPNDLGFNSDLSGLTSAAGSMSISTSFECKSSKPFEVFFDGRALISAVRLVDPPVVLNEDEGEGNIWDLGTDDSADFASMMSMLDHKDDTGHATTSSPPSTETRPKWTSRDLCIFERNEQGLGVSPDSFSDDESNAEGMNSNNFSTTLHTSSHPSVESSIAPRESPVVPTLSDITHDMPSPSEQEVETDSVMDGHDPSGFSSPDLAPLLHLPSLPSLLSSLDWITPVTNPERSHDKDPLPDSTRPEYQETCRGLMTEPQFPHDLRSGHDDLINVYFKTGIAGSNPSRFDTAHANTGISHVFNNTSAGTENLPFLKVEVPSSQLIAELSALSPHFSPLELLELTHSDGDSVEPKSASVQTQLLRAATSTPRIPTTCTPRMLWPAANGHHENVIHTPAKRPVARAVKTFDHNPPDFNQGRQTRRPNKRDRTRETKTPARSSRHAAAAEVRTNSWWDTLLQLFSTSGESGSQQLQQELQIDADRLLVPVCEGPMIALTEP